MTALHPTTDPPTEPGTYVWCITIIGTGTKRRTKWQERSLESVDGALKVKVNGYWEDPSTLAGWWAGPLAEPKN